MAYIHADKAAWQFVRTLKRHDLARYGRDGDVQWIGMHPRLAAVYMSALAQEIATANQLIPITDQDTAAVGSVGDLNWLASTLLGLDPGFDGIDPAGLTVMAVQSVVPTGLARISWPRLLEIRSGMKRQIRAFRTHMAAFDQAVSGLAAIEDPARAREQLEAILRQAALDPLEELEERFRQQGVRPRRIWQIIIGATSGVAVAETMQAIGAGQIGSVGTGVFVAAAFAHGVSQDRQNQRDILRSTPVSYLYELRRRLGQQTILDRIRTLTKIGDSESA